MKFTRKRVLWIAALVVLTAFFGWRAYEINDMRHHLKKLHVGMSYAEVRKALPSFLVQNELEYYPDHDPERPYPLYHFWMTIATRNRSCFLYFDDHLILQKLPNP
jgi:hypothetical protein